MIASTGADRYFPAWRRMCFTADGTRMFLPGRPDVIEVPSCAEAVLCAAALAGRPELAAAELPAYLGRSLDPAVRCRWVPVGADAGYFAWISQPRCGRRLRTAIPLLRGGQAWMLPSMAAAAVALGEER